MKRIFVLAFLAISVNGLVYSSGLDTLRLTLPSLNWAMQVELPGYELSDMSLNGSMEGRYVSAYNDSTGMYVSIGMEENIKHFNDAVEGRDSSWKQLQPYFLEKKVLIMDTVTYVYRNLAIMDYYVGAIDGYPVLQRNVIAYIVRDKTLIMIQLAKANYSDDDVINFNKVLRSLKEISPYEHVSLEHFLDGSIYFDNRNYKLACKVYQLALDANQEDHLLDGNHLRKLIANMGLAYGLSGQIRKAVAILNNGIAFDRFYPMFYYNLACVYAGIDNLVETIYYLLQANSYKKNMPADDVFPYPGDDDNFKKYLSNDQFKEALRAMK
jgi:tetratricopeptide (TPR) repeat protein